MGGVVPQASRVCLPWDGNEDFFIFLLPSQSPPQFAKALHRNHLAVSFIAFSNSKPGLDPSRKSLIPVLFAFWTLKSTILRFATLDVEPFCGRERSGSPQAKS